MGAEKEKREVRKRLQEVRSHCKKDDRKYADHCRVFALSGAVVTLTFRNYAVSVTT